MIYSTCLCKNGFTGDVTEHYLLFNEECLNIRTATFNASTQENNYNSTFTYNEASRFAMNFPRVGVGIALFSCNKKPTLLLHRHRQSQVLNPFQLLEHLTDSSSPPEYNISQSASFIKSFPVSWIITNSSPVFTTLALH